MQHVIDTGDASPIKQRQHIWSPYTNEMVIEEVRRMLALGVIEPWNSPWNSPMVGVRKYQKKFSTTYRFEKEPHQYVLLINMCGPCKFSIKL